MAATPMVVAYRVHPLSAWWPQRQSLIKHVNLINILAGEEVIPELLQELHAAHDRQRSASFFPIPSAIRRRKTRYAGRLTGIPGRNAQRYRAHTILQLL